MIHNTQLLHVLCRQVSNYLTVLCEKYPAENVWWRNELELGTEVRLDTCTCRSKFGHLKVFFQCAFFRVNNSFIARHFSTCAFLHSDFVLIGAQHPINRFTLKTRRKTRSYCKSAICIEVLSFKFLSFDLCFEMVTLSQTLLTFMLLRKHFCGKHCSSSKNAEV